MKRLLLLVPLSALTAISLAACGSTSKHATVRSHEGGSQTNATAPRRSGTVIYVGRWRGDHHAYRTIQGAVNAAHPGERILIAAGDYHESPTSDTGVRVTTPDIVIEGVDRNTVIIDGTKPDAPSPCDPDPRFQNLGPVIHQVNGVLLNGRNGIVIDRASGVTVKNLTICNFVGTGSANGFGNQLWFNGGAGTGKTHLGAYHVADITATSTYIPTATNSQRAPQPVPMAAYAGVLISNAAGPGQLIDSFASNMADSGFHVAGCPDCDAVFDHDTAEHNVIGFSGTDAGGRLLLENSLFEHNGAGVNLASENNEDAPPPQDGTCPSGVTGPEPIAPHICTVIEHNRVEANNNADVSPEAAQVFLGAGIDIAGGKQDLVFDNDVSDQGSYGIVTTVYENTNSGGFPHANCQEGLVLTAGVCFYNASGDLIADNRLRRNGAFENPTNGDLADATVADGTPNCYQDNADRFGGLTTAPHGLQAASGCAASRRGTFFSVLGLQVVCAVRAFGDCHGGNGNAVLSPLARLSHVLHAPFDASMLQNTRAVYPPPGHYLAPRPAPQASRHL